MGKVSEALAKAGADIKPVADTIVAGNNQNIIDQSEENKNKPGKKFKPPRSFSSYEVGMGWDARLVAAIENFSGVAESFRRLRANILHPAEGNPARSILVTSASPAEGKSFVCANLGVTMAHGVDQHSLMVDCDLRRPSLARFFGIENEGVGLVDHLRDGTDLSSLILKTGLDRLSLIPAGTPPENPSELLSSQGMANMIKEVVDRYNDRFIILDSPPAQAASETAVLAQHVDKVVLVVRWGGSGREQVKKLVEQLGPEKILGVVFNAFEMNIIDKRLQGEGYYKYYSEEY
ncbi:MAG: CpsD/CapB family tyrosine-protein kinase [Desulfobulbaceae bacterium]|nr:CpsD/CapB family tyrosine-protein kinase [Desulfobulbaceae bacterium]